MVCQDQSLTAKLGKVKVFTPADSAGLKVAFVNIVMQTLLPVCMMWFLNGPQYGDFLCSINGKEVFEMGHKQICEAIHNAGLVMELVVERNG